MNRRVVWVVAAVAVSLSSLAFAQTGPDLLLKPFRPGSGYELGADLRYFTEADVKDAPGLDLQIAVLDVEGRMKLDLGAISPNMNRAQPRAGFSLTHYALDPDGPTQFLPDNFTDVSVALGTGIAAGETWKAGITVGVGYAAAGAFGDGNGYYGKADLALAFDIDDTSSLGIVLNYDGNRSFMPDVPLPGFLYTKRVDDRLTLAAGIPFTTVRWTPDTKWELEVTWFIPDSFRASVQYQPVESIPLKVFAELGSRRDAFKWDALPNSMDRVIFFQNLVEVGLRGDVTDHISLTASAGYAFGQSFESGWDSRDSQILADIENAPFARLAVTARW